MNKIEKLNNGFVHLFSEKMIILVLIIISYIYIEIIIKFINQDKFRKDYSKSTECYKGYKLVDGICIINYSFEILYRTFFENEKVI